MSIFIGEKENISVGELLKARDTLTLRKTELVRGRDEGLKEILAEERAIIAEYDAAYEQLQKQLLEVDVTIETHFDMAASISTAKMRSRSSALPSESGAAISHSLAATAQTNGALTGTLQFISAAAVDHSAAHLHGVGHGAAIASSLPTATTASHSPYVFNHMCSAPMGATLGGGNPQYYSPYSTLDAFAGGGYSAQSYEMPMARHSTAASLPAAGTCLLSSIGMDSRIGGVLLSGGGGSVVKSKKRVYECDLCFKKVATMQSLRQHKRIHTGEKPFVCPIASCRKRFKNMTQFVSHLNSHKEEKPLKCHLCVGAFPSCKLLKKHMEEAHKIHGYQCAKCSATFSNSENWFIHLNDCGAADISNTQTITTLSSH